MTGYLLASAVMASGVMAAAVMFGQPRRAPYRPRHSWALMQAEVALLEATLDGLKQRGRTRPAKTALLQWWTPPLVIGQPRDTQESHVLAGIAA